MSQLDMFGTSAPAAAKTPTAEAVRERLMAVLDLLRAAQEMPWTAGEIRSWRLIFPQMSSWLPDEERQAIRVEFEQHMSRLIARAA